MRTVFDGHNDTLTHLYSPKHSQERSFFNESPLGHIDLPRARKGGFAGGFFAIFTRPPESSPESDPMYGLTFSEDGYSLSERSAIDPKHAQSYTDSVIGFAHNLEARVPKLTETITGSTL